MLPLDVVLPTDRCSTVKRRQSTVDSIGPSQPLLRPLVGLHGRTPAHAQGPCGRGRGGEGPRSTTSPLTGARRLAMRGPHLRDRSRTVRADSSRAMCMRERAANAEEKRRPRLVGAPSLMCRAARSADQRSGRSAVMVSLCLGRQLSGNSILGPIDGGNMGPKSQGGWPGNHFRVSNLCWAFPGMGASMGAPLTRGHPPRGTPHRRTVVALPVAFARLRLCALLAARRAQQVKRE